MKIMRTDTYKINSRIIASLCMALLFLTSMPVAVQADTTIFTEGCAGATATGSLATSTSITVGTSWSARITLAGSPSTTNYITAGTANCSPFANATNIGFGYTMTPAPSTREYYADYQWIDGGTVGATDTWGIILNYIDANNYYNCVIKDDATHEVDIYKIRLGVGSTIASATNVTAIGTPSVVKCQIDYTGTNPVITFTQDGSALTSGTDSTNPLTRTPKTGFMCGAMPAATGDDCSTTLDADTMRVIEVTVSAAPTVSTSAATSLTGSTATLNGSVTDSNSEAATVSGFAFGTDSSLVTTAGTTTDSGTPGTGDSITQAVSHLVAGKTYYFRAYATNSSGTGYGQILNFTTSAADTTVSRKMRLFEGYRIKFTGSRTILYQQ